MKLKLNESGNVIVRNGKPVYETTNGNEIEFDAETVTNSNHNLKNKVDTLNEKISTQKTLIDSYDGIDPEKAMEALANADKTKDNDSKLSELQARFDSYKTDSEKREAELIEKDNAREHEFFVNKKQSEFASSKFREDKTILTSEMAFLLFGDKFKKEDVDGKQIDVGYLNGEKIRSQETGNIAGFDEAFKRMYEAHPDNARWSKTSDKGGNGSGDGKNNGGSKIDMSGFSPTQKLHAARQNKQT